MGLLHGTILDATSGSRINAKVHVLNAMGNFTHPASALLKHGPGVPFFFSDGEFEVKVPRGRTDVLVERGTEYEPARRVVEVPENGLVDVEIPVRRWYLPQESHWYPGNTHIHYDDKETRPDERLAVDCSVEGYNVTVVSVLDRRQLPYASNKYPIGVMNEFTTAHHVLDIGEENRHYGEKSPWGMGYGHVMFLNIRNLVQPVSRGHILTAQFDPDYPPLCFCCDDARDQGGVVIWCHNGRGMEAPVAAALGKLDAFNLFDPFWMDPEYDLWYKLLNCGLRLPASTGTDWFVCSNNRVYVKTEQGFSYANWIQGMKAGKSYITNGPSLDLRVGDREMGETLELAGSSNRRLEVEARFLSWYPVDRVELVVNGAVASAQTWPEGVREGTLRHAIEVGADGWVAARLWGNARDSFGQSVYAHTSPVYFRCGAAPAERAAAARFFLDSIEEALRWIDTWGRYNNDQQRQNVKDLFRRGREVYAALAVQRP
ncbi:MAG: CehA/McbA family metallohydrolase [Planctomycetes bacterium]|nr:CehA/McbA family metallohydrolase [Planctomycetota bacterium]